jgi:hypothetical protein
MAGCRYGAAEIRLEPARARVLRMSHCERCRLDPDRRRPRPAPPFAQRPAASGPLVVQSDAR